MGAQPYIVCDGILGLDSNSDEILGWGFGIPPRPGTREELERCRLVVRFRLRDDGGVPNDLERLQKYHYWRAEPGAEAINYRRTFVGRWELCLRAESLAEGRPLMTANPAYNKYIRFRFNNLHSPGYLLLDVACVRLLMLDLAPIHCSAYAIGDAVILVVAPPDTGKTLTTMQAVMDDGADFMAEDMAITDGRELFACPWTSTFRYYDRLTESRWSRWHSKLTRVFPPLEFIRPPDGAKTIDHYIPPERIRQRGKVTHIAVLTRRPGGLEVLDRGEALRQLWNLNRYEYAWMKSPLLTAYSYFNPGLDPYAALQRERAVLERLAGNAECLLVQDADPRRYSDMIRRHVLGRG